MRGDEKLIETYGLSWERDIQNGVRYWMPQLNIKIDIFTTESWGIVGRSKFGKGVIELIHWIQEESKNQASPATESSLRPRSIARLKYIGLATKASGAGFTSEVLMIGDFGPDVNMEMRVKAERLEWAKKGVWVSVSCISI